MDQMQIYIMYVLLAVSVTIGSHIVYFDNKMDKYEWMFNIVRYVVYILTIQGARELCTICYETVYGRFKTERLKTNKWLLVVLPMYIVCIGILIKHNQRIIGEEFPLIFIAYLIVEYPEIMNMTESPIKYGVGMACNFYEGYLMHVIPADGKTYPGLVRNIQAFEAREGVTLPVKKLFIVITKSMHSPPDLELFNKTNRPELPQLEACSVRIGDFAESLEDVEKDIAGVKARSYKNTVYRIYRPVPWLPVSLVAECATPLTTLYKVIENRELYGDLADVNVEEVCDDFCRTLNNILSKSLECRGGVELVVFDDRDPQSNLADVLLDRIRKLEPDFEDLISARR